MWQLLTFIILCYGRYSCQHYALQPTKLNAELHIPLWSKRSCRKTHIWDSLSFDHCNAHRHVNSNDKVTLSQFHTLQHADNLLLAYGQHYLFSGVPLLECCHVDDALPDNMIVVLPPGWVETSVSQLYTGINPPQPGGTRAPSRSPPVSWWSERCTDSSVMILPGIWTCHAAKEAEPSCFNDTGNCRVAGSLPDGSTGNTMHCTNYNLGV